MRRPAFGLGLALALIVTAHAAPPVLFFDRDLAIVDSKACADAKARARLAKADDATKDALIDKLIGKGDALLDLAAGILSSAVSSGLVTPARGEQLQGFLVEIRQCIAGIPH